MMSSELIDDYVEFVLNKNDSNSEELLSIRKMALENGVPIIKPEMEGLLKTLLLLCNPKHILELGTAVGYSASFMLSYAKEADLLSLEINSKMCEIANDNLKTMGFASRARVINKDIMNCEEIKRNEYDFIFIDAAKSTYDSYYELALSLVSNGGIIVFDNMLQNGDVAKSRYAVPRKNRTIYKKMREFINNVLSDKRVESSLLKVSDGVLVCIKRDTP